MKHYSRVLRVIEGAASQKGGLLTKAEASAISFATVVL